MEPFAKIVGHAEVMRRLADALAAGRLAHGLLFAGPAGVGKFTVAAALAAEFLGGTDDVRRRVANQTHPDFHVVTRQLVRLHDKTGKSKATALSVDVAREEVVRPANRMAVEGGGKVFVIEEAETMNAAAQNAILKTLEEPHGRTLIVLLTDRPESLLPTVRSRCQTFRFGELSEDDAVKVLEKQGVAEADARRAVAVAGGSPGMAGQFLSDGVIGRAGRLFDAVDAGGAGVSSLLKDAAERHAAAMLERDPLASKDALTRAGHGLYLALAADHLRRRLLDAEPAEMTALCDRIDAVARADLYLSANVNVALALRQLELSLA